MGIAWYRKDQRERLREISGDADDLEETHDEWLSNARDGLKKLQDAGVEAEKIDVEVDELLAWCDLRGLPVSGESRSEFAADKIQRRYQER